MINNMIRFFDNFNTRDILFDHDYTTDFETKNLTVFQRLENFNFNHNKFKRFNFEKIYGFTQHHIAYFYIFNKIDYNVLPEDLKENLNDKFIFHILYETIKFFDVVLPIYNKEISIIELSRVLDSISERELSNINRKILRDGLNDKNQLDRRIIILENQLRILPETLLITLDDNLSETHFENSLISNQINELKIERLLLDIEDDDIIVPVVNDKKFFIANRRVCQNSKTLIYWDDTKNISNLIISYGKDNSYICYSLEELIDGFEPYGENNNFYDYRIFYVYIIFKIYQ
jgi:hypothetical protein